MHWLQLGTRRACLAAAHYLRWDPMLNEDWLSIRPPMTERRYCSLPIRIPQRMRQSSKDFLRPTLNTGSRPL